MKTSLLRLPVAVAVAAVVVGSAHAQQLASVEDAPNLNGRFLQADEAHQCYARVNVPAEYESEAVTTEIRPKLARFDVTPPKFENDSETVVVAPAMEIITAVQPEFEEETHSFEVFAGKKRWVRGSVNGGYPLTDGEIQSIESSGVDVGSVEVGACLYEHFYEATIEDVPTKVLVSQASEKLDVQPAVFEEAVVSVTVTPAHTRLIEVPPSFKEGSEKVMITPASKAWRTDCGALQQVDHMTGETLCLVDIPAKYASVETEVIDLPALITKVDEAADVKTINVKKLVAEAKEAREVISAKFDFIDRQRVSKPARYSWLEKDANAGYGAKSTGRVACLVQTQPKFVEYQRQVVKSAGRFEVEQIPEQTQTITTKKLVAKASSKQYMEEPLYDTVSKNVMVAEAKIEWKPVLCQVNFSENIIAQLQKSLSERGYEPGPIDGIMGRGTTRAIKEFQSDNNLADGGLTIETLEKLGVENLGQ